MYTALMDKLFPDRAREQHCDGVMLVLGTGVIEAAPLSASSAVARRPRQGRSSGERRERSLDAAEHDRTLRDRSGA